MLVSPAFNNHMSFLPTTVRCFPTHGGLMTVALDWGPLFETQHDCDRR